jgi:hypothetical protein
MRKGLQDDADWLGRGHDGADLQEVSQDGADWMRKGSQDGADCRRSHKMALVGLERNHKMALMGREGEEDKTNKKLGGRRCHKGGTDRKKGSQDGAVGGRGHKTKLCEKEARWS